jgi:hypothetical protein
MIALDLLLVALALACLGIAIGEKMPLVGRIAMDVLATCWMLACLGMGFVGLMFLDHGPVEKGVRVVGGFTLLLMFPSLLWFGYSVYNAFTSTPDGQPPYSRFIRPITVAVVAITAPLILKACIGP